MNAVVGQHARTATDYTLGRHVTGCTIRAAGAFFGLVAAQAAFAEPGNALFRRRDSMRLVTRAAPETIAGYHLAAARAKFLDVVGGFQRGHGLVDEVRHVFGEQSARPVILYPHPGPIHARLPGH